jgi:hypothetical protein
VAKGYANLEQERPDFAGGLGRARGFVVVVIAGPLSCIIAPGSLRAGAVTVWPMRVRQRRRDCVGYGRVERFGCAWVLDSATPSQSPRSPKGCTGKLTGGCARLSVDGSRLRPLGLGALGVARYPQNGCDGRAGHGSNGLRHNVEIETYLRAVEQID